MAEFNRHQWILRALRRLSYRYPLRSQAKVDARIERGIYKCYRCGEPVRHKDLQMDHIIPVAGPEGFIDWNDHIDRLLPPTKEGWGAIHKECHKIKTQEENQGRVLVRKANVDKKP